MDCINFTKHGNKLKFHSFEYDKFKENTGKIIHWIPKSAKTVDVEILMIDKTVINAVAEGNLEKVKIDDTIQFERFGFVRCDEITSKKYKFWFAHK